LNGLLRLLALSIACSRTAPLPAADPLAPFRSRDFCPLRGRVRPRNRLLVAAGARKGLSLSGLFGGGEGGGDLPGQLPLSVVASAVGWAAAPPGVKNDRSDMACRSPCMGAGCSAQSHGRCFQLFRQT